jgi:hypothetical protein
MTGKQLVKGWLVTTAICGLIIAAILAGCGCAMTPRMHMYAGRMCDLATTIYATEIDGGYSEANPLADGGVGELIALNVAAILLYEGCAWLMDEQKDKNACHWIGAAGGYGFGAYNLGLMLTD